jgi:hypothetical protein
MRSPRRRSPILLAFLISALVASASCRRADPTLEGFRVRVEHATQNNRYTKRDAARVGALEGFHVLGEEFEVVIYRHRSADHARAWAKRHGALRNGPLTLTVFKDVNQVVGSIFMGL